MLTPCSSGIAFGPARRRCFISERPIWYPQLYDEVHTNLLGFARLSQGDVRGRRGVASDESHEALNAAVEEFHARVQECRYHCHGTDCGPPSGVADGPSRDEPFLTPKGPRMAARLRLRPPLLRLNVLQVAIRWSRSNLLSSWNDTKARRNFSLSVAGNGGRRTVCA